jgi:membrane peptidoglycan carboxypeptidase
VVRLGCHGAQRFGPTSSAMSPSMNQAVPPTLSMADALARSPNTAFVKLVEFTGVPDVVDIAVRLGMKSLATTPFVDPLRVAGQTDPSPKS